MAAADLLGEMAIVPSYDMEPDHTIQEIQVMTYSYDNMTSILQVEYEGDVVESMPEIWHDVIEILSSEW